MSLTNNEIVWIGRDNSIDLQLWASGTGSSASSAVLLTAATQVSLRLGQTVINSTDSTAGYIRWLQPGYKNGEIRIFLGATTLALSTGYYNAALVVFDPSNLSGVVWDDDLPIRVKSDPLAT